MNKYNGSCSLTEGFSGRGRDEAMIISDAGSRGTPHHYSPTVHIATRLRFAVGLQSRHCSD